VRPKRVRARNLRLGIKQGSSLALSYALRLIKPQFLSIGAVVAYMAAFQTLALGIPLRGALGIALGSFICAVGLSAFLEGLFLGIMPLGSQCGMRLPVHAGPVAISAFAFILGLGATFAEPAVGFLRATGSTLAAWDSPLLYAMLNRYPNQLTLAIGIGVGIASLLGILRFLKRLPFKPFVFILASLAVCLSALAYGIPRLRPLLGLAWDSGGITTGPVTVPLILSLGLGMSRVTGKNRAASAEGFGVVALAGLVPVVMVMAMGAIVAPGLPGPTSREAFFSAERRPQTLALFASPAGLDAYARASLDEAQFAAYLAANPQAADPGPAGNGDGFVGRATSDFLSALQAILPLCLLLIAVLLCLKEKIRQPDELLLGLAFAIVGLFLMNWGMNAGLSGIGRQTGESLPASYAALPQPESTVTIRGFDESLLSTAIAADGSRTRSFAYDGGRSPVWVAYDPAAYDPLAKEYRYLPVRGPLFGPGRELVGKCFILLFAFVLGYIVTIAEPSLSALGSMVEDATAGTFRKSKLISSTAVGVGLSLGLGFARVLWDIPLVFILAPGYALLLGLTAVSADDMAALAWDAAGVTTGPVTVPLVVALGIGLGGRAGIADCFGVLACAGVIPVATVLFTGMRLNRGRARNARPAGKPRAEAGT
jgi:hypothetical protein